jgi:hypothetical protein
LIRSATRRRRCYRLSDLEPVDTATGEVLPHAGPRRFYRRAAASKPRQGADSTCSGTSGNTVRSTNPEFSRRRSVWVRTLGLMPANLCCNSPKR